MGEVTIERINRFEKLFEPDVIIVHRLLKNTVLSPEYVLMTGTAFHFLEPFHSLVPERCSERVQDIGGIETFIFDSAALRGLLPETNTISPTSTETRRWEMEVGYACLF